MQFNAMTDGMLRQGVISQLFPTVSCDRLAARVDCLLGYVRTEHVNYPHGPLRQALVRIFSNPGQKSGRCLNEAARATIRVQLREGPVFGMSLATGKDLHRAIELAGQWLSGKAYDERAFDAYDRGLNQHLREALGAAARCDVTLERNASVAPYPGVGEKMVCKIALATLNSLLEEYGSARVANLPDAMTAHFASQCSGRHGAVDSYLQQLDPAVLAYLDQAGEMHGFPLDQLKIYHHFAGEHATVTRNRLQAIRALPWLLTALSEPDATRAGFGADASAGSRQRPVEQIARAIDQATPFDGRRVQQFRRASRNGAPAWPEAVAGSVDARCGTGGAAAAAAVVDCPRTPAAERGRVRDHGENRQRVTRAVSIR